MHDYYNDEDIKIEYNPVINKSAFKRNVVGADAGETLTVKNYTDTDANTIYFDKTGNDTTGDGTSALPYLTVLKSINSCTAAKTKVICQDSNIYEEDISSYDNEFFEGIFADTGHTPILSRRTLGYTPADANSIFFDKTGNDTTGAGTKANPYLTIAKAVSSVDAAHQKIVCQDSETYEEAGIEFTGNFQGMYAAIGQKPKYKLNISSSEADYDLYSQEKAITNSTFRTLNNSICKLENTDIVATYCETSGSYIGYFKIYDEFGNEKKGQTTINSPMGDNDITPLNNGNFVIAFTDGSNIYFIIYDEDGNIVKSKTTVHSITYGRTVVCCTLNNGNFVIAYRKEQTPYGGYFAIYDENGDVVKSYTTFAASTQISYGIACGKLNNGNFVIAWADFVDTSGCFAIYDENGDVVKSRTLFYSSYVYLFKDSVNVFSNNNFSIVYSSSICILSESGTIISTKSLYVDARRFSAACVLKNDSIAISYSEYSDFDAYFIICDEDGNVVRSSVKIYTGTTTYLSITTLNNGNFAVIFEETGTTNSYIYIYSPYLEIGLKISVDSEINGIILNANDRDRLYRLIEINSFELTAKFCDFKNCNVNLNYDTSIIGHAIYGDTDSFFYNCKIYDNGAGIYLGSSIINFNCEDSVFYRNTDDYAIHIDGAGSTVITEHITLFQNYAGIYLENNNGNEVVKNLIVHNNDNWGLNADVSVPYSYSTNTDSINNFTAGNSVILANPLFINEGAIDPDDIDLNLKNRLLAAIYFTDSPAYLLADDDRDSGCYDVTYVGSTTTWTAITIPKPRTGFEVIHPPVGTSLLIKRDGSSDSKFEAWREIVTIAYKNGIEITHYNNILTMMINPDSNQIRLYPDPTTNANDFNLYIIDYKGSKMPASPDNYKDSEFGVKGLILVFMRAYE